MENLKIHFKGVSEENKEFVSEDIEKIRDKWGNKIDGEYEKNEEEIKVINVANILLQEEIKKLGIEPRNPIENDRVHFLNKKIAESLMIDSDGAYSLRKDAVFIVKDNFENGRLGLYTNVLHEIVHYYSIRSFIAIETKNNNSINPYRSGYDVKNLKEDYHTHFRGFNEAVVEKIVQEILQKNNKKLTKEFKINEAERKNKNNSIFYYYGEIEILNTIIEKIAEFSKKNKENVWGQIKKGLFNGEMMYLREVEKVFGPGSLRVLAAMTSEGSIKDIDEDEILNNLNEFFKETSQEKRNSLAKQILSERERLQYEKIIKKNENK